MKITDVEVIEFRTRTREHRTRWGKERWGEETDATSSITKISTDEGVSGYMEGGSKAVIEGTVRPLLLGEDPLEREKLWGWMDQMTTSRAKLTERDMGVVDCALWDLLGRMTGMPVHKLLGGARERVKAYAVSASNLGPPEVYAEHAIACKDAGYKAYKIHAYIFWDPHRWEPAPQQPGFPREDVEVCKAVRDAVGSEMRLMLDSYGAYTLEEAIWVGRELEKLDFYWFEHPMIETRMEAYRRLTRELDIAICSPEYVPGGVFSRAEWILQGGADMLRIDHAHGGLTACWKLANICQSFGVQCELHGGGWAHAQVLAATSGATCEYYERGVLRPGEDYDTPRPTSRLSRTRWTATATSWCRRSRGWGWSTTGTISTGTGSAAPLPLEYLVQVQGEPLEHGRSQCVPFSVDCRDLEAAIVRHEYPHDLGLRVRQPELPDPVLRVQVELVPPVAPGRGGGQDFDDEIRRPLDVVRSDDVGPISRDEQDVRLHDVRIRQHYVRGSVEDLAQTPLFHERTEAPLQSPRNSLVGYVRRRSHEQLSVQELISLVLRGVTVVLVRELGGGFCYNHADLPFLCSPPYYTPKACPPCQLSRA